MKSRQSCIINLLRLKRGLQYFVHDYIVAAVSKCCEVLPLVEAQRGLLPANANAPPDVVLRRRHHCSTAASLRRGATRVIRFKVQLPPAPAAPCCFGIGTLPSLRATTALAASRRGRWAGCLPAIR